MSRLKLVGLTVVILALAVAADASGQVIVRRDCYSGYHAPAYHTPAYAAPVHHAPTYYPQQYYYQPYALPVEITRDYYFSIDSYYRDKLLVDALVGRLVSIGVKPPEVLTQPQPKQPQPQFPNAPISEPRTTPTAVPDGLREIVQAKCIKCHGANAPGGRADLSDLSTTPEGVRWHAHGLVNSAEMPKGLAQLTDAEVLKFYEWAKVASRSKVAQK